MKSKTIKRKVKPNVYKKKGKQFNIDNFLLETFGANPGHFSFDDLQDFARSGGIEKPELAAIKTHLDTCERCKSIYDDIVQFDPFLSIGEPIPERFWTKFWKTLEDELPENVRKALTEALDEAKSTMSQTIDTVLVDYFANLEDKIIRYNSHDGSKQREECLRSITTLQKNMCTVFISVFWNTMQHCSNRLFANLGLERKHLSLPKPNVTFVSTANHPQHRPQNVEIQA